MTLQLLHSEFPYIFLLVLVYIIIIFFISVLVRKSISDAVYIIKNRTGADSRTNQEKKLF
jgi:hypothetical protein